MSEDHDLVTSCGDFPSHRAHLIPHLVSFLEVLTHPLMAAIAAGLDTSAGERLELDVRVVKLQERVEIPASYRVEALADDLHDLLRHRLRSIPLSRDRLL
jgi:hypothetical protein